MTVIIREVVKLIHCVVAVEIPHRLYRKRFLQIFEWWFLVNSLHRGSSLSNSLGFSLYPFQDLAAPGGDREDRESLCHHHHTLHRGGQASQRGEIIHMHGHTNTSKHTQKNASHPYQSVCSPPHRGEQWVYLCFLCVTIWDEQYSLLVLTEDTKGQTGRKSLIEFN